MTTKYNNRHQYDECDILMIRIDALERRFDTLEKIVLNGPHHMQPAPAPLPFKGGNMHDDVMVEIASALKELKKEVTPTPTPTPETSHTPQLTTQQNNQPQQTFQNDALEYSLIEDRRRSII